MPIADLLATDIDPLTGLPKKLLEEAAPTALDLPTFSPAP